MDTKLEDAEDLFDQLSINAKACLLRPVQARLEVRSKARQRYGEDQEADTPADPRKTPAAGAAANPPCRL